MCDREPFLRHPQVDRSHVKLMDRTACCPSSLAVCDRKVSTVGAQAGKLCDITLLALSN
jgi:hypothetical protein